jgi:predicted Zn finger-like uncharacterized protein
MQVACSRCRTRYRIPSEKLEAGPIKVRCKECDHIFGVRKKARVQPDSAPAVPVEAASPAPETTGSDAAPSAAASPSEEEELLSDAGFGGDDFGFGGLDKATSEEDAAKEDESAEQEPQEGAAEDDAAEEGAALSDAFGFGDVEFSGASGDDGVEQTEQQAEEQTEQQPPPATVEFDLSDFDSSVFDDDDAEATLSTESKSVEQAVEEASGKGAEQEDESSPLRLGGSSGEPSEAMGGFETNALDGDDGEGEDGLAGSAPQDFSGNDFRDFSESAEGGFPSNEPHGFPGDLADEALEQVGIDDLLTPPPEDPFDEEGDGAPRLDLRKGDRRTDSIAVPAANPAKKKGFPLVLALLLSTIIGSAAFVGYNALIQPDAAFRFLNPEAIMQWLERGQVGNVLKLTEPVEGAYLDRPKKDRLYVVSGWITNASPVTKSAIEVKGAIFGPDGAKVAEATAFCGNVIPQEQLMVLDEKEIALRLTGKKATASASLEIKPGDKAPFMVVFFSPPKGVGKFTVEVTSSLEPGNEAEKK